MHVSDHVFYIGQCANFETSIVDGYILINYEMGEKIR